MEGSSQRNLGKWEVCVFGLVRVVNERIYSERIV